MPGSEKLEVYQHVFPLSIDGILWADKERNIKINAGKLFAYFLQLMRTRLDDPHAIGIKKSEPSKDMGLLCFAHSAISLRTSVIVPI
jgi:hypothetical protein